MKQLLFATAVIASVGVNAQTRLIAYKSHSGSSADYTTESFGNFGLIEMPRTFLRTVEKVNDTTVIVTSTTLDVEKKDTVHHHPHFNNPELSGDSLRKMYHNQVEFRNFEPKDTAPKKEGPQKKVEKQPAPVKQPQPSDRKKNTLWLLVIGGGTFLGTGLIAAKRSRRKVAARYA